VIEFPGPVPEVKSPPLMQPKKPLQVIHQQQAKINEMLRSISTARKSTGIALEVVSGQRNNED